MFKALSKIYLTLLVLGLSFNLKADQEFDPTMVEPEIQDFLNNVYKELDLKNLEPGLDFKVLPSQMLEGDESINLSQSNSIKRFEPVYSIKSNRNCGKIYINERIFNQLNLEEKRYLIGKALARQHALKKFDKISSNYIFPAFIVVMISGVVFMVHSEIRPDLKYTPTKSLCLATGFAGCYYLFNSVYKALNNFEKISNKAFVRLNSYDGAISYFNKLLKLVKEKKISEISEKEINSEIKKAENLKKVDLNKEKTC